MISREIFMRLQKISHFSVVFILVIFLSVGSGVQAASNQMTITQSVTNIDTDAPTIPANVIATAVGLDQITLTWNASTDNVAVTGYQVFRDAIQIATTTSLSYPDTGLLSGTTYSYRVTAFDAVLNFSTTSLTSQATTFTLSSSSPSLGGGGAHVPIVPHMTDLKIIPDLSSAQMTWGTSVPTRTFVSWGVTHNYEMGSLEERALLSTHRTKIMGLSPGTRYFFRIIVRDGLGNDTVLTEDSFSTPSPKDIVAPPNVHTLRGVDSGSDAVLTWMNPAVADFGNC